MKLSSITIASSLRRRIPLSFIKGPDFSMLEPKAQESIPIVSEIIERLKNEIGNIPGALIEEKKISTAAHYRLVENEADVKRIKKAVDAIIGEYKSFRLLSGKKVFEILPDIDWDKGKAIRWIVEALGLSWNDLSIIYIGDDVTDEYAFRAVRSRGTGILVSGDEKSSAADFQLSSVDEVRSLFEKITS